MAKQKKCSQAKQCSLGQLRREVSQRVSLLEARKEALEAEIAAINGELAESNNGQAKRGRPVGSKNGRHKHTGRPLIEFVKEILTTSKQPLTVGEIMEQVQTAGYKTFAKDFYPNVMQAVTRCDQIVRASRGHYELKAEKTRKVRKTRRAKKETVAPVATTA